jgi:rhodanese-related sulfurtransferase
MRSALLVSFIVLLVACGTQESSQAGVCTQCAAADCTEVSGDEAQQLVAGGAQLVDVRTPEEYAAGHIEGATNIPLSEVEVRLGELDRERDVVVYCRSGNRSGQASELLCAEGFTVYDMGPATAWP